VYEQYRDADTIEIPGPRAGGGAGNRAAYAVLLSPAEAPCLAVDTREESSCMEFGIGARPYRDADTIRIVESHQVLDQGTLIRTYQADNTRSATGEVTRISLRRSAWVYVMIDIREKTLPKWMQCSDSSGCWELVTGAIRTNAPATYRIYRRFFDAGIVTLGGLATDRNNYFVVVKEPEIVTVDGVDPQYQVPAENGVNPFHDDERSIEVMPPVLDQTIVIQMPYTSGECVEVVPKPDWPARVYLGVDTAFTTIPTFLDREGWTRTDETVTLTNEDAPRELWYKDFGPGAIYIQGIHCDGYRTDVGEMVVFLERRGEVYRGLQAENLRVRGFSGQRSALPGRRAENDQFMMRNLDVAYAWSQQLTDENGLWDMRMSMSGGRAAVPAYLNVLAPFVPSPTTTQTADGEREVSLTTTAALSDLAPIYIDADSVEVSTIDLRVNGRVRVAFHNKGAATADHQFAVVLFEDVDGDYVYDRGIDNRLGRALVDSLPAKEIRVHEIEIDGTIAYPERVLFAVIDADLWVQEENELNNTMRTPTVCETWEPTVYVVDKFAHRDSTWRDIVPLGEDAITARWLDTDSSGTVNDSDDVCLIWTDGAEVWAMEVESGDTVRGPIRIDGLGDTRLNVVDLDDDGLPELLCGSRIYNSVGSMLWDGTDTTETVPDHNWDFDGDGVVDSVGIDQGCVTIWNTEDSLLLYVSPWNMWPDPVDEVTTDALARIVPAERKCYDASISWPRVSRVNQDTLVMTVRVANAGGLPIPKGIVVTCLAGNRQSVAQKLAEVLLTEPLQSTEYHDLNLEVSNIPSGTSVWCRIECPGIHELRKNNNYSDSVTLP